MNGEAEKPTPPDETRLQYRPIAHEKTIPHTMRPESTVVRLFKRAAASVPSLF